MNPRFVFELFYLTVLGFLDYARTLFGMEGKSVMPIGYLSRYQWTFRYYDVILKVS